MTESPTRERPPALIPCPEVLDFLLSRRSRAARTLTAERPDDATLAAILAAGIRVPDHGMLTPWRLVQIERGAMADIAAAARARADGLGLDPAKAEKTAAQFTQGGVILAVVSAPVASDKIPRWEQELSAGAVCATLLYAALASGWGANWLTGPLARDAPFLSGALGLDQSESVAGFIHVGGEGITPAERARPDGAALITRLGSQ